MKTCRRCDVAKALSHYSKHKSTRDGLQTWCNECRAEWLRNHRREHPEKWIEYNTRHREKNRAVIQERKRQAYRDNPGSARKSFAWKLKREFGLTLGEYDVLVSGPCHICGCVPPAGGKRPGIVLDHCHETGKVRGALCQLCNTAIGKMGDDPARLRAAADYLEMHARSFCDSPGLERLSRS